MRRSRSSSWALRASEAWQQVLWYKRNHTNVLLHGRLISDLAQTVLSGDSNNKMFYWQHSGPACSASACQVNLRLVGRHECECAASKAAVWLCQPGWDIIFTCLHSEYFMIPSLQRCRYVSRIDTHTHNLICVNDMYVTESVKML